MWRAVPSPDTPSAEEEQAAQSQIVGGDVGGPALLTLGPCAPATIHGPALPEAAFDDTTETEIYRLAYRNFRLGHYRGARGERPKSQEPEQRERSDTLDDLDPATPSVPDIAENGVDLMDADYASVQEYRMAYRRHRLGAAHGAKGEITDLGQRLSAKAVRLLPVFQLVCLRRHLAVWEEGRRDIAAAGPAAVGLHLHVGAGRLGLGLALPALVGGGRPFAVVQRPSAAWAHAATAARTEIRVNGQPLVSLRVVKTRFEAEAAMAAGEKAMLVLTEAAEVLQSLIVRTLTFSCSIGGKELSAALEPLFEAVRTAVTGGSLTKNVAPPPLYCLENDHEAVKKLEQKLGEQLELVPVLVDRVCTGRVMGEDGSVDVATEGFPGEIVVPPSASGRPREVAPFGGPTVRLPSTAEGAEFLHRKKILTVNGTHTTLAFLTLVEVEPSTVGPPQASHELLAFDAAKAVAGGPAVIGTPGRVCWVWAVARQLMLLDEFPDDVLRNTLGADVPLDDAAVCEELLKGAEAAVRRLSQGGDQTSRVLGGGVVNRWQGRLANVAEWLELQKRLTPLGRTLLQAAGITSVELRQCIDRLVDDSRRFTAPRRRDASRSLSRTRSRASQPEKPRAAGVCGVLFDFDGTLGDTELPAMEVAFWVLAPYLPSLDGKSDEEVAAECPVFVRENAGKAFEHMIEACDELREATGLPRVEATRGARQEPPGLSAVVDRQRAVLGLRPVKELRQQGAEPPTLLQQQKDDTITRLAFAAEACPGVIEALVGLQALEVSFVIATTSGKPRVPVCVDTSGLRRFFPSDDLHIHSGESDFDPPRFKPAPDVYLRAASHVKLPPSQCVAVEDSASGVGSASNAGIGLIVGYVGASHIAPDRKEPHARMLMKGVRAENRRGADIVLLDMCDLPCVVRRFATLLAAGRAGDGHGRLPLTQAELPGLQGGAFFFED